MKNAHPTEEEWMSYLYTELPSEAREALSNHLQRCSECRTTIHRYEQTRMELDVWRLPAGRRTLSRGKTFRWAAAAILLLTTSFVIGRWSAHDTQRQARFEKAWEAKLAATRADLESTWQREQTEFLRLATAEIGDICRDQTQETLDTFAAQFVEKTSRENARVMAALHRVDEERIREYASLRKGLEMVAVLTEAGFQETQQQFTHLANTTLPENNPHTP